MAEVLIKEETLASIADKIREKTGRSNTYKPQEMAENINDVYDAGKQAEYDAFWDSLQQRGTRTGYNNAFCHWKTDIFKPKYNMKPTRADGMFNVFSSKVDLVEHLKACGVTLDTSKATAMQNFCSYSQLVRVGEISFVSAAHANSAFEYARELVTIDKMILATSGSQALSNTFLYADKLENITIEGVIGQNISFGYSPLSKDSIISIVNALSSTASGKTLTLKKTAVNNAFGIDIDDEATWGEGTEFYSLRHTKDNWTFSYA